MAKKKYTEGVWELENLKLGYYHAFEIMKKQNPKMTELEYLELIALPTAIKGHNNYYATVEKAQNKLEMGKYVKWIEERMKQLKNPNKIEPKSFEELFNEPTKITDYIRVLKMGSTDILNDNGDFIGGKNDKCIIVAWTNVLIERGKMKKTDSILTTIKLLKKQFPGFTISSKFSNSGKKYQPALTYFKKHL